MTARATRQGLWFASALFVLSGATGLAYEVIWFKRFAHVWGSSSLAMASVVASFLAGLGLGARIAGRLADKSKRPLFGYALCEGGIALCALVIPFVIPLLVNAAASLYPLLVDRPLVHTLVRVLVTFIVLGPPCVLMGATLPLLVRHFAISGQALGRSTAWLYAFNALGAAAGGWIAGFYLLPALGLEGTNYVAAGLNLAVAAAALFYRVAPAPGASDPPSADDSAAMMHDPLTIAVDEPPPPAMALNTASLIAGFGALLLQMIWGRELAVLLGPTTYAFTAMVFVFILGLGIGSLVFLIFARERSDLRRWIAALVFLLIASTIAGRLARPQLAFFVGSIYKERSNPTFNAALCATVSAALQFVPTLCMGALFPALVQLTRAGAASAAASVGRIYAWNTAGSIAGALLALNWIVPSFGTAAATALALGLYVSVLVLVLQPFTAEQRRVELAFGVLCGALLVVPWYREGDPRLTNLGLYIYGSEARARLSGPDSRVLFFKESSSANVMVMEQDQLTENGQPYGPPKVRNVRVNGKVDGSNFLDMSMQLGTAYFPLFLRPETKDVLVIGMGTGTSVGASLQFPDTQVTVCEIEPAILEGSRFFAEANHDPHSSPRFHAVIDDGRNFMQASDRRFDLIISEPSNPWIAGVSNLFTHEFYVAAKAHLAPQGILTQWIQTYQLSAEQYALVVRTISQVFPHCALIRIDHQDTLLLASQSPILPSRDVLARAQEIVNDTATIHDDLKTHFGNTDVRTLLLTLYMLDQQGLSRMLAADGHTEINTDINLRLEFEAPRDLFGRASGERKDPQDLILASVQPQMYARTVSEWGYNREQLNAFRALRGLFQQKRLMAPAVAMIELALAYEPDDPEFMADQMCYAPAPDPAEFVASVRRLMDLSIEETYRVGKYYAQSTDPARGRIVLEALRDRQPQSATIWTSLAAVYAALARTDDAMAALAKAIELDPLNSFARDMQRAIK